MWGRGSIQLLLTASSDLASLFLSPTQDCSKSPLFFPSRLYACICTIILTRKMLPLHYETSLIGKAKELQGPASPGYQSNAISNCRHSQPWHFPLTLQAQPCLGPFGFATCYTQKLFPQIPSFPPYFLQDTSSDATILISLNILISFSSLLCAAVKHTVDCKSRFVVCP